jgi:trk system potassium uptake protein TrkA
MNKFLIIGLGIFGRELAVSLIEKGAEVVAVDQKMELVEDIQDQVTYAIRLDAMDERALSSIGLEEIDVGVVCIGEDFESNLLAAVHLKNFGVKTVIARASNPTQEKILKAVGVDLVITPEMEAAERLSYRLMHQGLLDVTFIGGGVVAAKIQVPEVFVGKTPAELQLRTKYGVNLIAIHRPQKDKSGRELPPIVNNNPDANAVFEEGDIMVLIGNNRDLQKISKLQNK